MGSADCSGFRKLCWGFLNFFLRISQSCLFLEHFWAKQCLSYLYVEFKTAKNIQEKSNVADSATIVFLVWCGILWQFTKCSIWPRSVFIFLFFCKPLPSNFVNFVNPYDSFLRLKYVNYTRETEIFKEYIVILDKNLITLKFLNFNL